MLVTLAQAVLAAGQAGAPAVTRAFLAAGPGHARICEQIAVYPSSVATGGPGRVGDVAALMPDCAVIPTPGVTLAYSKDCWPLPQTPGGGQGQPQLPDPADMTAWTVDYLATAWAILDAVLAAYDAGTLGDCSLVTVGPATFTGPTSGVATMLLPVTAQAF